MSEPKIVINADASKVEDARKKIEALRDTMRVTREDSDEGLIGRDSLHESNELIRQISENITRMKSLVLSGENKGGILNVRQMEELGRTAERINDTFGEWYKNISSVRTELFKLTQERQRLESVSTTDPTAWLAAQERISELYPREKELQRRYDKLNEKTPRIETLERKTSEWSNRGGTLGVDYGKEDSSSVGDMVGLLKKTVIGYGLYKGVQLGARLAGAFEGQAPILYEAQSRGFNTNETYAGYGRIENAGYGVQLARSSGYTDKAGRDKLHQYLDWSRNNGYQDAGFAVGMSGSLRDLAGKNDTKVLNLLASIADHTRETPERMAPILLSGMSLASARQMGGELSLSQSMDVANLMGAVRNVFGASASKDPSMAGRMQGAFQSGNRFANMLFWQQTGTLEKEDISFGDINRVNRLRRDGATTEEGRRMMAGMVNGLPEDMAQWLLEDMFGNVTLKQGQTEKIQKGGLSVESYGEGDLASKGKKGLINREGGNYYRFIQKNALKQTAMSQAGERAAEILYGPSTDFYNTLSDAANSDWAKELTEGAAGLYQKGKSLMGSNPPMGIPAERQLNESAGPAFEKDGFFGLWRENMKSWLPTEQDKNLFRDFIDAIKEFTRTWQAQKQ